MSKFRNKIKVQFLKRKLLLLFSSFLMIIAFQNCGQTFTASDLGSKAPIEKEEIDNIDDIGKIINVDALNTYNNNCAGCHGSMNDSEIANRDAATIRVALDNIVEMRHLKSLNLDDEMLAGLEDILKKENTPGSVNAAKYTCSNTQDRGMSTQAGHRITQFELKQTIKRVFGNALFADAENTIELYPKEVFIESVTEFDSAFNQQHMEAIESLGLKVGELAASVDHREDILPACMITEFGYINLDNTNCNQTFVNSMGLKLLGRPVSTTTYSQSFNAIINSQAEYFEFNRHRIAALITAMMLTPEFSLHVYQVDNALGSRGKLDSYSIAKRMSFKLTGGVADDALLESARLGELNDAEKRKEHAVRLMQTDAAREKVRYIFHHYLFLDKVSQPNAAYASYIGIDADGIQDDLKKEALDFVEHIVFEEKGNYRSLLTSSKSFPPSTNSAKIFGSSSSSGPKDPRVSTKGHKGLAMRPVLMISPEPRTSPIKRGLFLTRNMLCNDIPEPDPDLLLVGEGIADNLDLHNTTSREMATAVTSPVSCNICHKHINPAGFALEKLGPLGDIRSRESIFDINGNDYNFVKTLPIDLELEKLLIGSSTVSVNGTEEFINEVVESSQGKACFAESIFKFSNFQYTSGEDDCHLSEMEALVRDNASIEEVLIQHASSEDNLWLKIN